MFKFIVEQLGRLPRRPTEVWQGGFVRMPMYIPDEEGQPARVWGAFWVAVCAEKLGPPDLSHATEESSQLVWETLVKFAVDSDVGGYLPGRVEVRDPALAEELRAHLDELGVEVACTDELHALDRVINAFVERLPGAAGAPGALTGAGVTVERMRSFAHAAVRFYEAAPWKHLSDEDLLEIRSPLAPPGLRYATVLGGAGQVFGLGFFDEPQQFWDAQADRPDRVDARLSKGIWALTFDDLTDLPIADANLWEDHDLPLPGPAAYPNAMRFSGSADVGRPDASQLAYLEGLLLALARATEAKIDAGRWTATVATPDCKVKYTITLPDLLSPPNATELMQRGMAPDRRAMERVHAQMIRIVEEHDTADDEELNELFKRECGHDFDSDRYPPRNALESAQELCFQAFESFGRRRIQLARRALEVCPDCADACVILAEDQSDVEEALKLFAEGMTAAERGLGAARFESDAGRFWSPLDTRPYMRARLGLAQRLEDTGRAEEAADHYEELLRLNPEDNQGVRYLYLRCLMELGLDHRAARFMKENGDEDTASWRYTRALLTYRLSGDSPAARKDLSAAVRSNPLVVDVLLADEEPRAVPQSYSLGSPEEAVICGSDLRAAVITTPGARRWLESGAGRRPQTVGSQRERQQRGKRRKRKSR